MYDNHSHEKRIGQTFYGYILASCFCSRFINELIDTAGLKAQFMFLNNTCYEIVTESNLS